ncbi:MAG: VWA domain-containing protein, partial [Candidatus Limnocylindrales bacterium]
DRGDPALVGSETARLRRNCHRLIWLNPLAGADGYRPLAAGMAAAYPYLDDFLPANDLASLEHLARLLGQPDRRRQRDAQGRSRRRADGAQARVVGPGRDGAGLGGVRR